VSGIAIPVNCGSLSLSLKMGIIIMRVKLIGAYKMS
jgi:hypothetical protein